MIYYILSTLGGFTLGVVIMCLCAVSGYDNTYQAGYYHGHEDGFRDGIRSIDEVG